MTRYTVTAERIDKWWSLQCVEVPGAISQVKRLADAHIITEAIAFVAEVEAADVELIIQPALPFTLETGKLPRPGPSSLAENSSPGNV